MVGVVSPACLATLVKDTAISPLVDSRGSACMVASAMASDDRISFGTKPRNCNPLDNSPFNLLSCEQPDDHLSPDVIILRAIEADRQLRVLAFYLGDLH